MRCRLCSEAPRSASAGASPATARRGCSGCCSGVARKRPVTESGLARQVGHAALRHQRAAALAGAGADVDEVVGAADGVLVVLHHHQRVALVAQLGQRAEQDAVVARVQADGGLVEHVAHALQVAAQLRRQPDALRLAAAERGRGAVQRQVAQAHVGQEFEPAPDLGDHVARDLGVAAGKLPGHRSRPASPAPTGARSRRWRVRRRSRRGRWHSAARRRSRRRARRPGPRPRPPRPESSARGPCCRRRAPSRRRPCAARA